MGILYDELVFGPIKSRRLGISLGVNLLPHEGKVCTFDCIYCECGWAKDGAKKFRMPQKDDVLKAVEQKIKTLLGTDLQPTSLTFAGNGEPTLHPEFAEIVDGIIALRNKYLPKAVVSVLTNGTMMHKESVFEALERVDNNIMKLDAGTEATIKRINLPNVSYDLNRYIEQLKRFKGDLTIQTLFLRGTHQGQTIDNTTPKEVNLWIEHLKAIKPKHVMMYVIDRETPESDLVKISHAELEAIGKRVEALGISVGIYA